MRIGYVTQWFPPESPALVASTTAFALAGRGHDVEVVTGFPNYPEGVLYPGYTVRPYQVERINGVNVHRGPLYPSHDKNAIKRIANYSSFAFGALGTSFRVSRPDVWLTNSTPITASVPGMAHRLVGRVPHAQIIQDLWPDSVSGSGLVGSKASLVLDTLLRPFCSTSYRLSDSIGVISPGMADLLASRGVPASRIHYVPNAIDDSHLLPEVNASDSLRSKLGLPSGFLFMYAGNFGKHQALDRLIDCFAAVPSAQLVLVGSGVVEGDLKKRAKPYSNISFIGRKSLPEVGEYIAASDVQVVSLEDSPLLRVTLPSKFQASIAAGRPILALASGDCARIVAEAQIGFVPNGNEIAAVAAAIRAFTGAPSWQIREMGARARSLYLREYSAAVVAERLEVFLEGTIESASLYS